MSQNDALTVRALGAQSIQDFSAHFNADRANRVAANAAVSMGLLKAATDYKGTREAPLDFNIELKQGSITNQEQSGRCWMFAGLNVLRFEMMHTWHLADIEFSENYLLFWEKMEKANTYLEYVLDTIEEDTDSRIFQTINAYGPIEDGNWWDGFAHLVRKYGLVPKSAYPESQNSRSTADFIQYTNSKLREFAIAMRKDYAQGVSIEELRDRKAEYMDIVYRMCAIALGEPPRTFDFFARVEDDSDSKDAEGKNADKKCTCGDKCNCDPCNCSTENESNDDKKCACSDNCSCDEQKNCGCVKSADCAQKACSCDKANESNENTGCDKKSDKKDTRKDTRKFIEDKGITPLEFYHKYIPVSVDDFTTVSNCPQDKTPFGKRYSIRKTATVIESGDMQFLNVDIDTLRNATIQQLKDGHAVWFAADCTQFSLRKDGFFDPSVVRVDELFGTTFTMSKADGLEYQDSPANHAMTFIGVHLDDNGQPVRWKVENSWGKDAGRDGYYVATAEWFDRYVTETIILNKYLDLDSYDPEVVEVDPWVPLTKRSI